MRLALAQLNAVVGDLDGNREKILEYVSEAGSVGADLIVFPELATTGYPPEDLLLRPSFVRAAHDSLEKIAAAIARHRGLRRHALVRARSGERMCRLRRWSSTRRLPQAFPSELRRVRRASLLRRGPSARARSPRRRDLRTDDLRGRLAARPTGHGSLARRSRDHRQPLGVAVSRGQGRGARGDARHTRARHERIPRVLQHGRRAGRARLRRPLGRARPVRRGRRARSRLRGAPARRRHRTRRSHRPPAARRTQT